MVADVFGILKVNREQAFEPGYTTIGGGTSIGLPGIQQIALAHDGTMRITDGTDSGARFKFTNVKHPSS